MADLFCYDAIPELKIEYDGPAAPGFRGVVHADVSPPGIVWWREEIAPHDYNAYRIADQTFESFFADGPPCDVPDEDLARIRAHVLAHRRHAP